MSQQHADIGCHPRSLSNRSLHLAFQGHGQSLNRCSQFRSRVQSICLLFVSCQLDHVWPRYSKSHIRPWKFKVKVMAKVKPDGHIWGLEFNQYVCFSCRGNRITFSWDIKFHVWHWKFNVKVMAKVKSNGYICGLEFSRYVCFLFPGDRIIFGWDIANSIFDLENSRSQSYWKSTKISSGNL